MVEEFVVDVVVVVVVMVANGQPGSLEFGDGAVGTLVFIEGAVLKSNRSSSVAAYWSRAVRCCELRNRFSTNARSDV